MWIRNWRSGSRMVEKKVPDIDRNYYTRRAKEIKTPSLGLRLAHTRKSAEMHLNINCKETVEKKLSKEQQELSLHISEAQKIKDEKYMKRIKNKKKSMIIEGQT